MKGTFSVAIDGPSSAGKSTVAKLVSSQLNILYLNTGDMYRAFGFYVDKNGIDYQNENDVNAVVDKVNITVEYRDGMQQTFLNGENVTQYLRSQKIGMYASIISSYPAVRIKLASLQREIAKKVSMVLDGRDIGTYVLPDAKYKFFLVADAQERAKRRYLELKAKDQNITLEEVLKDIKQRDFNDTNREFAPLKKAHDAIEIDTTDMNILDVVKRIITYIKK